MVSHPRRCTLKAKSKAESLLHSGTDSEYNGRSLDFYDNIFTLLIHLLLHQVSLLTTNHANTGGARGLPPVFGTLVSAIAFLSLDIGLALPGSGCLVGRFEDQLMIETAGFITILVVLVFAYLYSKAQNHDDAWIQLRRAVDVSDGYGGLL